jgi:hypothetical protein
VEKTFEEPKKTFWVVDDYLLTAVWMFGGDIFRSKPIIVLRKLDEYAVSFSAVPHNKENLLALKQAGFEEVEPPVQR